MTMDPSEDPAVGERQRLVVALTYPVSPPLGGGQVRAFNLYRGLARRFDVELVALVGEAERRGRTELAPGLWEQRIPKSASHAREELAWERAAGTVVTDVSMISLYELTPQYMSALREAADGARAAVACHPYTFPAIRAVTDIPVWYEAQDVEAVLKQHVLGAGEVGNRLRADVEQVERACCQAAEVIWTCSEEDRQELVRRYSVPGARILVVPNGAALDEVAYVPMARRRELRRQLRIPAERALAMFMASWHEPNVVGARRLLQIAAETPDVEYLVLGSVGLAVRGDPLPDNVQLMGAVSLGLKQTVLSVVDVALNPVTTGSGTNLKMLDYFAAGTPVISTGFGARGLGVRGGEHFLLAEPDEFKGALDRLSEMSCEQLEAGVAAARMFVETRLSWATIVATLLDQLDGFSPATQLRAALLARR
jgi:glycosyltransferase involved in cell wall biosynthesis